MGWWAHGFPERIHEEVDKRVKAGMRRGDARRAAERAPGCGLREIGPFATMRQAENAAAKLRLLVWYFTSDR